VMSSAKQIRTVAQRQSAVFVRTGYLAKIRTKLKKKRGNKGTVGLEDGSTWHGWQRNRKTFAKSSERYILKVNGWKREKAFLGRGGRHRRRID